MMVTDKAIGQAIRSARKRRGMSQAELGDKLGVTYQQVQKYEKGLNRIALPIFLELAAVLDLKAGYYVRGWITTENRGHS